MHREPRTQCLQTNGCSRTLAGFKAINVPEQRFLEIPASGLFSNDAASDLASPLARIFDTKGSSCADTLLVVTIRKA